LTVIGIRTPSGRCEIRIGNAARELERQLGGRGGVMITDANVRRLHPAFFSGRNTIEIPPGEGGKTLPSLEEIYVRFLEFGLDRSSFVVGVGGGVVCDLAGFAAATYLRGLDFGFVPTTLLAQVDAAIGGKNGLNFLGYKNMIGVIRQPEFVLSDPAFLRTLPAEEIRSGFAEVIKSALVADAGLFEFLEQRHRDVLALDDEAVRTAVAGAASIKAAIVQADEREANERRKLNFGHTLGHALEKTRGLRHGEAVACGMVMASRISASRGMLPSDDAVRIERLLVSAGLPTAAGADPESLMEAIRRDKKRDREDVLFVCLASIGRAEVVRLSYGELEEHIHDLHQHR